MTVKIRLARGGSKKKPYYRIVISDVRARRDGRFIERVGSYNPMLAHDNENRVVLNKERVEYWLKVGAKPTDRVARFLDAMSIGNVKRAIPEQTKKNLMKAKARMRLEEAEQKVKEAQ